MFRDNSQCTSCYKYQSGFLLPLALFILVAMAALAATISRSSTQSNESSVMEFTNIQSFYAAESGAQRGMQHLFFINVDRASVDGRCSGWSNTYSFTAKGLKACTALVSCALATDSSGDRSFYTITSIGRCGTGRFLAERVVEVGSFLEQE